MRSIFFMALLITLPLHGEIRDFSRPLTPSEQEGITYVISTLGGHSIFTLSMYKKNLEAAGAKTDNVHPLRFFEYVLTEPNLRKSVKKISGIAWSKFSNGMEKNFQEESERDNLTPEMISQFSESTGVDEATIKPQLESHKWEDFMNTVRKTP